MVRSAGIVSGAVFLSRISGLVREVVMARLFGAGMTYDAFRLGFLIPNLTRDLFAEGALSSAFVPTFTTYLTTKNKEEAERLFRLTATAVILIVGLLCLLGTFFAPELVGLVAGGFKKVPGKYELAVSMTRIMFPFLLLVALAALVMGVLNSLGQFGVPAFSSTLFNVGSVIAGLGIGYALGPSLGVSPIEGMAWGVVVGGALQLLWQLPSLRRKGFTFRPAVDFTHPGLRHIVSLMGPAILGNAAVQINVMVNTNFASALSDPLRGPDGPVSWLGYAFRFMMLPLGLFGVAIGSATLPQISRNFAAGQIDEFRRNVSRSIALVFLLTVPSSVGLVILGPAMIGAVYQGGEFASYDTQQTALALSYYAVGLAGYAALKVLNPAFYALGDARTPMFVSLASIVINFVTVSMLIQFAHLRHEGLALTTSAVALFGFLVLFWRLRRKTEGIYGRALAVSTAKILVASVAMAAAVAASDSFLIQRFGEGRAARLLDLAVSIPLGAAVFGLACYWLRVAELELAINSLRRPLSRLLPFGRAKVSEQ